MLTVADVLPTITTGTPWQDLVRLAAILVPGIIVLAMSLVVIWKYARVYALDLRLAHAQGRKTNWRGLLPAHVAVIAISYCGLIVMLITSVATRFREPLYSTPRTVLYSVFLWLGVAALHVMTTHSKRRAVSIGQLNHVKPDEDPGP